ncbi:MAG: VCBS repeat-containing protein [Oscillospiraceae bacterium]|nr:VCBS repeat-containing protein [Oscillospiraceae bacterium]
MKKRMILLMLTALSLTLLCTGCLFVSSAEELYTLPQVAKEYVELQSQIDAVLETGAEYSAPISGSNRQAVQLQDLDGDGVEEAVGFFVKDGEKPLSIMIFRAEDTKYKVAAIIEGDGAAIDSVSYVDMDGDGTKEIAVGWQMTASVKMLSIYSVRDFQVSALVSTNYEKYSLADLNDDSGKNVIVYRFSSEDTNAEAEMYSLMKDGEVVSSSARLSEGITSMLNITTGKIRSGSAAVFIDSEYSEGGLITDILISDKADELTNITMDADSRKSVSTIRAYTSAYCTDINSDGVIEVPQPRELYSQTDTVYRVIDWRSYRKNGASALELSTYHNYSDSWFLKLPSNWHDDLTIRREDSVSGERVIIFSKVVSNSSGKRIEDLLAIYTLSGENRNERARVSDRFILKDTGTTVYVAKILSQSSDMSVTREYVSQNFRTISTDWTNGIV